MMIALVCFVHTHIERGRGRGEESESESASFSPWKVKCDVCVNAGAHCVNKTMRTSMNMVRFIRCSIYAKADSFWWSYFKDATIHNSNKSEKPMEIARNILTLKWAKERCVSYSVLLTTMASIETIRNGPGGHSANEKCVCVHLFVVRRTTRHKTKRQR